MVLHQIAGSFIRFVEMDTAVQRAEYHNVCFSAKVPLTGFIVLFDEIV